VLAAALALAASVSWGVADFLGGLKSRTLAVIVVLALAQPVGFVAIGLIVAVRGEGPSGSEVLWAIPAAALGTVGIGAFYKGMAAGSISIVAPVAATGAAIPVVVGIARGDDPSALQLLGFPLAIGGAALAAREREGKLGRARLAAGVPWAVVAAVGFGAYFVPMHAASEHDFLWAALVFRATVAVLVLLALVVVRPRVRAARGDLATIACIGVLDSAGNTLFAASAGEGLVSVVSVLASLYPVVTVALAWLWLRERIDRVQTAGVAVALAGVGLVAGG
jgi:drug/metabolite transporter (DMT)-like permease